MILRSLLNQLGLLKPALNYNYLPDGDHIEILNCWTTKNEDLWYHQYIKHHFSKKITSKNSLLLSSVFGPKKLIKLSRSHKKIFYTGENVERYHKYEDHCRNMVDIAIGFDYLDNENYQRFPYWLEHFFLSDTNSEMIRKEVSTFVNRGICKTEDKKFTSLVCSHDDGQIRTTLLNSLNKIAKVDSGGKYLKNTNALLEDFADNKRKFIGHYKFNICPENSNREGYVTEKVFEAIKSNTIPIYWGSNNNPEPEVLNKDAILFYNGPDSIDSLNKQVEELHNSKKLYNEFLNQPKFNPHAEEYIINLFESLHTKILRMLTKGN